MRRRGWDLHKDSRRGRARLREEPASAARQPKSPDKSVAGTAKAAGCRAKTSLKRGAEQRHAEQHQQNSRRRSEYVLVQPDDEREEREDAG